MLYRGFEKEGGRIIKPNELVYGNIVLNKDTGMSDIPIALDKNPIKFINSFAGICVFYDDYIKNQDGKCFTILEIDILRYKGRVDLNGTLHFKLEYGGGTWPKFTKKCKRLLSIKTVYSASRIRYEFIYINHANKLKSTGIIHKRMVLDNFIIALDITDIYIYDICGDVCFQAEDLEYQDIEKLEREITDMNVYEDGVEFFIEGKKYILTSEGLDRVGEEWSLRPTFTPIKSARKID